MFEKNLLCTLSIHNFKWEYVSDNSCLQKQVCQRCGEYKDAIDSPTIHNFKWEYVSDNSCLQKQVCQRCGETGEEREVHELGEWLYLSDSSCEAKSTCTRCDEHSELKIKHRLTNNSCEDEEYCVCGEYLPPSGHSWGPEVQGDLLGGEYDTVYEYTRTCTSCGDTQSSWGDSRF